MRYLIGVDIGTTGTKAVLIDERGEVLAAATEEYPLYTPRPLWTEQEPADWWRAAQATIKQVLGKSSIEAASVVGIGLTGQQHGSVFLNSEGQIIRRALLWNDQRTAAECAEIDSRAGAERVLQVAGNRAMPGFTAPKILWLRNHEPQHYAEVSKILMPKDYIRYQLSGAFATDANEATGTLLQDVTTRDWSGELLMALEIPRAWLPEIVEGPDEAGRLSESVARELGLPAGIPLAGGGGDNGAAAIGTGVVRPGTLSSSLGTSGVLFAYSNAPRIDPNGTIHTFCGDVPGTYALIGVTLAAGGSLRWLRDTLRAAGATHLGYEAMLRAAADVPPGAEGLLFLPYISGERMPVLDPLARGAFVGLTARHSYGHLVRAVVEGVTFALRDCLDLMRAMGLPLEEAVSIGGGGKSALWRQIQADVFGMPLVTLNVEEGPAYGAALLAGVTAGVYESPEAAAGQVLHITSRTEPKAETQARYEEFYAVYQTLYGSVRAATHCLAALDNQ